MVTRLKPGPKRRPLAERFWEKVEKGSGCWLWTASTNAYGYGVIGSGGNAGPNLGAHRVSWELHYGPVPEGAEVCHHCDVRPCVRPDHLFLGTHTENMRDMGRKKRARNTRCRRGHELSPENVYLMPSGRRQCRTCRRENMRRWHAAHADRRREQDQRHYERHRDEYRAKRNADYALDPAKYKARSCAYRRRKAAGLSRRKQKWVPHPA